MSTMLKSAAMALLSKTLQTFLYKYLSDVDVEGVALPSLYSSDASSGWGVRLCNVKLRDGVQLMKKVPGSFTKKRKRKKQFNNKKQQSKPLKRKKKRRKKKRLKKKNSSTEQQQQQQQQQNTSIFRTKDNNKIEEGRIRRQSLQSQSHDSYHHTMLEQQQHQQQQHLHSVPSRKRFEDSNNESSSTTTTGTHTMNGTHESKHWVNGRSSNSNGTGIIDDEYYSPPRTTQQRQQQQHRHRSDTLNLEEDLDILDDIDDNKLMNVKRKGSFEDIRQEVIRTISHSSTVGGDVSYCDDSSIDGSRPGTPVQMTKGILSCLYKSQPPVVVVDKKTKKSKNKDNDDDNDESATAAAKLEQQQQQTNESRQQQQQQNISSSNQNEPLEGIMMKEKEQQYNNKLNIEPSHDDEADIIRRNLDKTISNDIIDDYEEEETDDEDYDDSDSDVVDNDDGDEHDNDDNDDDDEDEWEEYDQPMELRLGEGGRIGTLDVRLIGKDLHVLVEDAFLSVEVVPIKESANDEDNKDNDKNDKDTESTNINDKTNSDTSSTTTTTTPPLPKTKDTTKPKEPVLAENAIARAISAIPHLFLRDIRIRLILHDDGNDEMSTTTTTTNDTTTTTSSNTTTATETTANDITATATTGGGASTSESMNTIPAGGGPNESHHHHHHTSTMPLPPDCNGTDRILELGIDFLSVTSGEDILSHFQPQTDEESGSNVDGGGGEADENSTSVHQRSKAPMSSMASFSSVDSSKELKNEYLIRHIRTGRGPEGGIWLKVYTPQQLVESSRSQRSSSTNSSLWARQRWYLDTNYYLFRLSGLDLRTRIYLGIRKEEKQSAWFYEDYDDEYDDYNSEYEELNSMLLGVDYVAPGPQLPLPPPGPHMNRGNTPAKSSGGGGSSTTGGETITTAATAFSTTDANGGPTTATTTFEEMHHNDHFLQSAIFKTDSNGIQSCKVPSSFHRIARGMIPGSCKSFNHLPCETCSQCWEVTTNDVERTNLLDNSTPMPGLVLQITMRDPLEMNIDRISLETVGYFQRLFQKKKDIKNNGKSSSSNSSSDNTTTVTNNNKSGTGNTKDDTDDSTSHNDTTTTSEPSPRSSGIFSSFLRRGKNHPKEDTSESFSSYMKPETIQITGIHLSEIFCRVHVMKANQRIDDGLSFCYWDLSTRCITIDRHELKSKEKQFQDVRFDVGYLTLTEYRGTDRNDLVSLGMQLQRHTPERERCDSAASTASLVSIVQDPKLDREAPWPSTACALLDIPAPLETLIYKNRDLHGIQLRYISVIDPTNRDDDIGAQSLANIRLGVTSINVPMGIQRNIPIIRKEAMKALNGGKEKIINNKNADNNSSSSEHNVNNNENTNSTKDNKTLLSSSNGTGSSSKSEESVNNSASKTATSKKPESVISYKFQFDGGRINMTPIISLRTPLTQFTGEWSSDKGVFMETILQRMQVAYGKNKPSTTGLDRSRSRGRGRFLKGDYVSIHKLAALPDNVRMRILLFLKDLRPLEQALGLKKEPNSFLRCRTVNKGIVKMSKKLSKAAAVAASTSSSSKKSKSASSRSKKSKNSKATTTTATTNATTNTATDSTYNGLSRRQQVVTEILKLDDDELDELWKAHQKLLRKMSKRRSAASSASSTSTKS